MLLCTDDIMRVRESISKQFCKVLWHCREEEFIGMMCSDLQAFAKDEKWSGRQLFAMICSKMWEHPELLEFKFLNLLLGLCQDAIVGVRISAGISLKTLIEKTGKMISYLFINYLLDKVKTSEEVQMIKQALLNDPVERVKDIFIQKDKNSIAEEGKAVEQGIYISEVEAIGIDLESLKKEIEQEVTVKVAKMPVGIRIDEIEP